MAAVKLDSFELSQLPSEENQDFEFKGSATKFDDLANKLSKAVSGFANSGGGCFVAGVDNKGNPDGGISLMNGRQSLLDWVDRVIASQVTPPPLYGRITLQDPCGRGIIEPDRAALLVSVSESPSAPHMAGDHRYYVRVGAHTEPAPHFIVEALWAKRHYRQPAISHICRITDRCANKVKSL